MSSVHKRKIANKYRDAMDDIIYGDESKASQASTWLDAISTAAKGSAEIAAKKAAADKAKADAEALKAAQDDLLTKQTAVLNAQQKAMFEKEADGPEHKALAKALTDVQVAQAKVTALQTGTPMSLLPTGGAASTPGTSASGRPWYFYAGIAGAVLVGGAIVYRLVSHGGSGRGRYVSEAR